MGLKPIRRARKAENERFELVSVEVVGREALVFYRHGGAEELIPDFEKWRIVVTRLR